MHKTGIFKKIFPQPRLQIIKNRNLHAAIKKSPGNMTADIARATNNQNSHKNYPVK